LKRYFELIARTDDKGQLAGWSKPYIPVVKDKVRPPQAHGGHHQAAVI